MNFASDGADEPSAAAKTGEIARPVITVLIAKITKDTAGLQLNCAPLIQSLVPPARADDGADSVVEANRWPPAIST